MSDTEITDHPLRSSANRSVLLVVDVQERLFVAIPNGPKVAANIGLMLDVADSLEMPVLVTEHMAGSIGRTVAELRDRLPERADIVPKTHFSAWDEEGFRSAATALASDDRTDYAVCGMETHVCVQQTALGLLAGGNTVRIVADACGSRDYEDRTVALERLRSAGADIVTAESLAFEWLRRGDTPAFKKLLRTIRDRRGNTAGDRE